MPCKSMRTGGRVVSCQLISFLTLKEKESSNEAVNVNSVCRVHVDRFISGSYVILLYRVHEMQQI
jgi:hypothetical protein